MQLAAILSITIRNLDKNVCILKGLVFEWLRPKLEFLPDPLKSEPFEKQSSKSLYLKKFQILSGWISDPHCIQS